MAEPAVRCPVCDEPLAEGAEMCANCGAAVSEGVLREFMRAFGIDAEKAHRLFRSGYRSPDDLKGRAVDDVLKAREPGVLYLCPQCGAFVSSADETCGKCGAKLAEEAVDLEQFLEGAATKSCPACGDRIPAEALVCPSCEAEIIPGPALEATTILCAKCGATALEGQELCDGCGEPLRPIEARPVASGKGIVCPSCGAVLERGTTVCSVCDAEIPQPAPEVALEEAALENLLEESADDEDAIVAELDELAREVGAEAPAPEPATDVTPSGPGAPRPVTRKRRVLGVKPAALHPAKLAAPPLLRTSPVFRLQELAVYATLAAFIPSAFVAAVPSEVGRWAILAAVGSLAAGGLALAVLGRFPFRARGRESLLGFAGGIAILAVPLHSAAGSVLADAADAALLVIGAVLVASAAHRFRRAPEAWLPWLAALPGLLAQTAAIAANRPTGSALTSAATWGTLAFAVGMSAAIALRERWVDLRVANAVRRAEDLAVRKEYQKSIAELDRAILLTGEEGAEAPWYGKGAALVLLGRYEEALTCIDTALRINPRNETAWVNKGNALARMGRLVEALKCYNSAIKVNPGYEVSWNNKGNALARMGKFEDALRCYDMALRIDSSYRGAWVNKGYVLTKLGRYEAAAECADEALRLGGAAA